MKQRGRRLSPWLAVVLMACGQGVAGQDVVQGQPVDSADPSCPSQDFAQFLRYFTDLADDRVRVRYTSDPLEYEAPAYDHAAGNPVHHAAGGRGTAGAPG